MAVDYFEGWDDYSTAQINRYWTGMSSSTEMCAAGAFDGTVTTTSSGGRNSSGSAKIVTNSRSFSKTLLSKVSRALGVAVKITTFGANLAMIAFGDAGTSQVTLVVNADATLSVRRGTASGTLLGTSTLAFSAGIWYYVEFKATIDPSAGSFTVNVNGVQWLTASSQNTRNTANSTANQIAIGTGGFSTTIEFDDLYSDDAGTFYGDCRVETKFATADGASSSFTRSTGTTNWGNISETVSNDDTNYNYSASVGQIDLYTYPGLTTTAGNIKAVMTVPVLRNDSAGSVTAASTYRIGTVNYFGTTATVGSTTYAPYVDVQGTDPATGTTWTIAGINAAQFGLKRIV